jgi:TolA-binding protein
MRRLLCFALFLASVLTLALSGPVRAQAQEPTSGIVQVAVSYGPKQEAYFSGVVVGDGRMILTDAAGTAKAREIAIAFSDGEVLETVMAQIQYFNHVAMLPMTSRHGQVVPLSPLGREISPQGDVEAVLGGAPKSFQVDRRPVHLHPVGSGSTLRWQITPPPPAQFRGGPVLSSQGQLIAMVVLEDGALVGMPLGNEMVAMVDVSAGPSPAINAAVKAPDHPTTEPTTAPKSAEGRTVTPPADVKAENTDRPREEAKPAPVEASVKTSDKPAAVPADSLTSVFKDAAIAPLHVEAPVVPRPPPAASGPTVPSVNVPLPPIRAAWAWKAAVPPPAAAAPAAQVAKQVAPAAPPQQTPPPDVRVEAKNNPPKVTLGAPTATASADSKSSETARLDVDTFLHQAADLMQKKDYPKAVDTLEEALRVHPEAANLHFQLALAYWYKALQKPDGTRRTSMEKGSYHKAMKSFETFLEKAPNDPLANEARMRLTVLRNAQYGGG